MVEKQKVENLSNLQKLFGSNWFKPRAEMWPFWFLLRLWQTHSICPNNFFCFIYPSSILDQLMFFFLRTRILQKEILPLP